LNNLLTSVPAVHIKNLVFAYPKSEPILRIPELKLNKGESLFLHGPSGSGKTTLLGILSGVLQAQKGDVLILGQNFSQMSSHKRDLFRGTHIGYIFQMFNLIPYMSVMDNILLSCRMNPLRCKENSHTAILKEAKGLLDSLGISETVNRPVTSLSVGQAQRVAAARALLGSPEIIIADEPTSALDTDHRTAFMDTLLSGCIKSQSSLIFVSHDHSLAKNFTHYTELKK
jgi:putative ABC transport system ATP-binding protein